MTGEPRSSLVRSCSEDSEEEETLVNLSRAELSLRAKTIVEARTKDWEIINLKAEERIPRFHRDEIELSHVLGKGGFFVVSDIKRITLRNNEDDEDEIEGQKSTRYFAREDEDYVQAVVQNRKFMARHCLRHGRDPRYAFKTMQEESMTDPQKFVNSLVDMAIEFKFLSSVRHPNIIKMRAASAGDIFEPNSFLVLDKIYDTLTERIKKWKQKEKSALNILFNFYKKRQNHLLAERLLVAYDIASALAYLHDMNIMYRDLKPNNVGFDVRNDPKLFDFGLATEFRPDEIEMGTYKLTGDTGTMRYMAPEVALSHPYTEKADVYSFGVLLWEICEMEAPYYKFSTEVIEHKVIHLGYRPRINPQWPHSLRQLMQDCFAISTRRPSMEAICTILRQEINQLAEKELVHDDGLIDSARSADLAH